MLEGAIFRKQQPTTQCRRYGRALVGFAPQKSPPART